MAAFHFWEYLTLEIVKLVRLKKPLQRKGWQTAQHGLFLLVQLVWQCMPALEKWGYSAKILQRARPSITWFLPVIRCVILSTLS